jgi:hypothetical protein
MQGVLGGGQKAVLQAFDAVGVYVGKLRRWEVVPLRRNVELGHRYATHATN